MQDKLDRGNHLMATTTRESDRASDYRDALAQVLDSARSDALHVDTAGAFPRDALDVLARTGLMGLMSSPAVGGRGHGLRTAAEVIERLAGQCGSTAMVLMMHFTATAVIEEHGPTDVRSAIAAGEHLTTLAFSEFGSRSHFWSATGTAVATDDGQIRLDARKSWVTSAGEADSYVWSSLPVTADGPMTLWLVPRGAEELSVAGAFDGLGLRGNGSSPMSAEALIVPRTAMLGADGAGLDIALATVLPRFLVLNAAFCLGLAESAVTETGRHLTRTTLQHTGKVLRDAPVARHHFARLRVRTDALRTLIDDTLTALETDRPDALLRVLEVKAFAAETAADITDGAMQLCGGSAFRKESGIERGFRDSRAARVMAPTTDALLDFIGRVCTGLPLLDEANR